MRSIILSKTGINKIRSHHTELKTSDFDDSVKSIPPGEWCLFCSGPDKWVGFINPMIDDKFPCANILGKTDQTETKPEDLIRSKLLAARQKRDQFKGYENNTRLFYGINDGLPGLIIDQFANATIIQINTAGVDKYREFIKSEIATLTGTSVYFLDNPKYREKESLPFFENEPLPDLEIIENGIEFRIRSEVMQKVGFYFDHRENRYQLMSLLPRLKNLPENGVDLFSYAGAWGMSALKSGVGAMKFVDQGDFADEVNTALKLNGFHGCGEYVRSDVFKFLDEQARLSNTFDLVLCDPPAFAKSALQKPQALEGYSKLHRKVFKVLTKRSVAAFSSCTHYVGHEEFQKNILDAAFKENRKVQLIYAGIQGFDHPIASLNERSSYIKSNFYLVE